MSDGTWVRYGWMLFGFILGAVVALLSNGNPGWGFIVGGVAAVVMLTVACLAEHIVRRRTAAPRRN